MASTECGFISHPFGRCVVKNFAMDSSRWSEFSFRPGDIVIASWARSGTTWLQQIVAQLLFGPDQTLRLDRLSPWLEHRVAPVSLILQQLQSQSHRRFIKTHLPANAVPLSKKARYLFIGRDGRDIAWSVYNFHRRHTPLAYQLLRTMSGGDDAGLPSPVDDFGTYFDEWLAGDGYPWWPFWSHIRSWWSIRDAQQICLVHYTKLTTDYEAEVRRIARFLEVDVADESLSRILELATFESMRSSSASLFGLSANRLLNGGMKQFFHCGKVNGWREVLSPDRVQQYEERATKELPRACAGWLASGEAN